jgi:hypothetical protein
MKVEVDLIELSLVQMARTTRPEDYSLDRLLTIAEKIRDYSFASRRRGKKPLTFRKFVVTCANRFVGDKIKT